MSTKVYMGVGDTKSPKPCLRSLCMVPKAKLKMSIFNPLDHEKWPTSELKIREYEPESIQEVSKLFGVTYNNILQKDFNNLVTTILKDSIDEPSQSMKVKEKISITNQYFWCRHKKDDHSVFWIQVKGSKKMIFFFKISRK